MTRILVLSDIHSNIVALEAVLADAGAFDRAWCLGDIVGYGPAPNECIERVRGLNALSLAGNHDLGVLGKLSLDEFNGHARRAVLWTKTQLKPENQEWLDSLESKLVLEEPRITLVHGSPRYPSWEYILSAATASENLSYFDTSSCLFGHTHIPRLFAAANDERVHGAIVAEGRPLSIESFAKWLLNPGSVGQPRDRDPRAAYAIYDPDAHTVTGFRVAYEIGATQAAMEEAHLPRPLIERLEYGI